MGSSRRRCYLRGFTFMPHLLLRCTMHAATDSKQHGIVQQGPQFVLCFSPL
jgi:hypothetical protein